MSAWEKYVDCIPDKMTGSRFLIRFFTVLNISHFLWSTAFSANSGSIQPYSGAEHKVLLDCVAPLSSVGPVLFCVGFFAWLPQYPKGWYRNWMRIFAEISLNTDIFIAISVKTVYNEKNGKSR